MKIGIFTDTYYPQMNGVTISIDNYSQALRDRGHEVTIFAPKLKGAPEHEKHVLRLASVKLISSEPETRLPLLVPNKNLREMVRMDLDLIHAHGNGAFSFLGYEVAQAKNIPFVMTFHTMHADYTHYFFKGRLVKPRMVRAGLRIFGNLCDGIVTPSQKMKDELIRYGVKKKIEVIPSFINLDKFKAEKNTYLHELLGIDPLIPIILSVGRLGKEKNFEFLLKAFARLVKDNLGKEINLPHFVLVGQGSEKENLLSLVNKLKIGDLVHLTGKLENNIMPQVYSSASLFVFASKTETQGIVLLEAIAAGLPLLVVDDRAFDNIIIDGKNGYLSPLKVNNFAAKMATLIKEENLRQHLSHNSEDIFKTTFSAARLTEKLINFYTQISVANPKEPRKMSRLVNQQTLFKFLKLTELRNRLFN